MKNFTCLIFTLILFFSCKEKRDTSAFFFPAEWEPQEAEWMGWDGNLEKGDTLHLITASIIKELHPDKKLVFIDATYVNANGGGIHCMTRQVPNRIFTVE